MFWLPMLLCACLPPLSSVEGKACDDAHPCPDALFCVANVCRVEPGTTATPMTRSVLSDDCEAMGSWTLFGGGRFAAPVTPAHEGSGACRLQASDGQATEFGVVSRELPVQSGTWCATVAMAQGPVPARATLALRRFGGAGGTTLLEESPLATLATDAGTNYRLRSTGFEVDLATTTSVRLAVSVEARVGASVLFDAVQVTQTTPSLDGGCP